MVSLDTLIGCDTNTNRGGTVSFRSPFTKKKIQVPGYVEDYNEIDAHEIDAFQLTKAGPNFNRLGSINSWTRRTPRYGVYKRETVDRIYNVSNAEKM